MNDRINLLRAGFASALAFVLSCCLIASDARALYISEIDLGGPAGRGIEFSGLDPVDGATLLMIDANPYLPQAFGKMRDVLHRPGSAGVGGVVMVTENEWVARPTSIKTLNELPPESGKDELNLFQTRLLVLMSGSSMVKRSDTPLTLSDAAARYDAGSVTDWLVLGSGDPSKLSGRYASRGQDEINHINTTLGINLLSRVVDKDAGRVIARAKHVGEELKLDQFVMGDPDGDDRFEVRPHLDYFYTPGFGNLPLVVTLPEPGTLGLLTVGLLAIMRRARPI